MSSSNKSVSGILLIVATLCLSILAGCSDISNLQVNDCKVVSVSPRGLTSLDATLALSIFNPGPQVTVYDIEIWLKEEKREIIKVTSPSITIEAKRSGSYEVDCSAALQGGLSLFDVRNLVSGGDFSSYYVDIQAYTKRGESKGKPVRITGLPLSKLIRK